ncbi:hypothetical protein A4X13_0g5402 [Tilletia indica]|uniref:Uncharacterized protein n=1 Tax=Tilletia indica TaxID=43049 RepID=A0A177TV77_9BASI|nr:hypothetical protein A4X13_0g5402 [Tilletia indica]
MPTTHAFPYLAKATLKYRSPHEQDLTFAKGETIRVLSAAPKRDDEEDDDDDDDDDWLVGESLDGSRKGTFPAGFVAYEGPDEKNDVTAVDSTPTTATSEQVQQQQQPHESVRSGSEETAVESANVPQASVAAESDAGVDAATTVGEESKDLAVDHDPAPTPEPATANETDVGAGATSTVGEVDEESIIDDDLPVHVHATEPVDAPDAVPTSIPSTDFRPPPPLPEGLRETIGQLNLPSTDKVEPAKKEEIHDDKAASSPIKIESTPVAATTPVLTASASLTTSPKPSSASSSFRDRIAAFNKPVEAGGAAPPPVPRGKPGGWKRPTPTEGSTPAPLLPGKPPALANRPFVKTPPPPPQNIVKSSDPVVEQTQGGGLAAEASVGSNDEKKGLSAADAKSSITMSLKERMAALQRGAVAPEGTSDAAPAGAAAAGDSIGSSGGAPSTRPPIPGKLSMEMRNIVLVDPGLAASPAAAPARSPTAEPTSAGPKVESSAADTAEGSDGAEQATADEQAGSNEHAGAPETTAGEADAEGAAEGVASTPEEEEAQRRAAIAQRLARLGGRRVGAPGIGLFGQPMPVGGLPPVSPSKPSASKAQETGNEVGEPSRDVGAESSEGATQDKTELPGTTPADEGSVADAETATPAEAETARSPTSAQSDEAQNLLAVPRRAGPPRRKKGPAPTPPTTIVPTAVASDEPDSEPAAPALTEDAEEPVEVPEEVPEVTAGASYEEEEENEEEEEEEGENEVDSPIVGSPSRPDMPAAPARMPPPPPAVAAPPPPPPAAAAPPPPPAAAAPPPPPPANAAPPPPPGFAPPRPPRGGSPWQDNEE